MAPYVRVLVAKGKLTRKNQIGKLAEKVVERALKGSMGADRPQGSKEARFGKRENERQGAWQVKLEEVKQKAKQKQKQTKK